jgi:indole-3-glycerol phosphate synthase
MSNTEARESEDIDFSGGVRGRFFHADAVLVPPVHLEPDVLTALQKRAQESGISLDVLVNQMLREELRLPVE